MLDVSCAVGAVVRKKVKGSTALCFAIFKIVIWLAKKAPSVHVDIRSADRIVLYRVSDVSTYDTYQERSILFPGQKHGSIVEI